MTGTERTLLVFKPDAVCRGLVGRILQRFEDAGFKIVGMKMRTMDDDFTARHYFDLAERHGPAVYAATAAFVQSGPVIGLVVEGVEAVAGVRRIVGTTYPNQATPGTIRGDFAHTSKAYSEQRGQSIANLVHASGTVEEATYEVGLWFAPEELFDYQILADRFTL